MTYSIIARDRITGELGIAVASRFFAVGAIVPYIRHNVAVATQAFVNPMWGVEGIERLASGEAAQRVMEDFISRDPGQALRQAHMIDSSGHSIAHTGDQCTDWAGHREAPDVSVAGNMLTGPEVVARTLECYLDSLDLPFADRLLSAMEAGEMAGGDKRGRQSAALRTHRGQDYPYYDLRVDDLADPLKELGRLKAVAEERYIHFAELFGTVEAFPGTTERADLDRTMTALDAERRAKGVASRSAAYPPTDPV
ncbi:MAG: DUF1028 domain-containing protein [Hyphomicrobiaceae bacterium]